MDVLSWIFGDELWSPATLWRQSGIIMRGCTVLLAGMFANTIIVAVSRVRRYRMARAQSRRFVRHASAPLERGALDEVLKIAHDNPQSHVAAVIAAGISSFVMAAVESRDDAIDQAHSSMERTRATISHELNLGLTSLATIASLSPFVGLFGTVNGILNSFRETMGDRTSGLGWVSASIAEALMMTALGLMVAIPAVWFLNYLRGRSETLATEMSNTQLELLTSLHRCDAPAGGLQLTSIISPPPMKQWGVPYDRQRALLLATSFCLLYLVYQSGLALYWHFQRPPERFGPFVDIDFDGGDTVLSPDRRYRAVIPDLYRHYRSDFCGRPATVDWQGRVALRISPMDRPREWQTHYCADGPRHILEPDEVLVSWTCRMPRIMWRTNEELLVECDDCEVSDLSVIRRDTGRRLTIIGRGGRRLDPSVFVPPSPCS